MFRAHGARWVIVIQSIGEKGPKVSATQSCVLPNTIRTPRLCGVSTLSPPLCLNKSRLKSHYLFVNCTFIRLSIYLSYTTLLHTLVTYHVREPLVYSILRYAHDTAMAAPSALAGLPGGGVFPLDFSDGFRAAAKGRQGGAKGDATGLRCKSERVTSTSSRTGLMLRR